MKIKKILSVMLSVTLLFGVISMLSACKSVGTTYYVSFSEGNDENSGTSKNQAWKTFKNVAELVLGEGDKIALKRGDVWNERLTVRGHGSEEYPAVIGAYGDKKADKPMIKLNGERDDIGIVVTDVSATGEAIVDIGNIVIEDIAVSTANVGLYVRPCVKDGDGLVIRNLEFYDILCDETLKRMGPGCTMDEWYAFLKEVQGDLPLVNTNTGTISATGGGAGEFQYSIAISVGKRGHLNGYKNIEIYDNIMYNCITGIEIYDVDKVNVHNNIVTGSFAGIVRASRVNQAKIYNNRILGGSDKYTFFGGTCGGYAAICTDIDVYNNEFSYVYNLGQNDGTGFDYEAYCKNATLTGNVFHHNDAGGILIMANENTQHENVLVADNLFYTNIINPRNNGYVYDILFMNKGDKNLTFKDLFFYTPFRANGMRTHYYGSVQNQKGGTIIEEDTIVKATTDDYRTRFSFNKDGYGEGFGVVSGSFTVAGGKGIITAEGKKGVVKLDLPQNGFAYNNFLAYVANNAKGTLHCEYEDSDGVKQSAKVKVNGAGGYIIPLANEIINGFIKNFTLVWTPSSANAALEMDFAQFTPDITVSAEKTGENEFTLTFGGKCVPMLALSPEKENISINGYTVTGVERNGYNKLKVNVAEKAGKASGLEITVKGDLFLEYFADMINGFDVERYPADDAKLLGTSTQYYYLNGGITLRS